MMVSNFCAASGQALIFSEQRARTSLSACISATARLHLEPMSPPNQGIVARPNGTGGGSFSGKSTVLRAAMACLARAGLSPKSVGGASTRITAVVPGVKKEPVPAKASGQKEVNFADTKIAAPIISEARR